ncbi:PspC domain-containing protein [Mucilaginibacter pedocola]|uniref:Phage shock protein PspC N-terminal domain-containing protein n=1 Tax=Mucilaginibacter pedocola TaxID=1792845 RepID=A0A1S9PA67_9SPHI|nr:PspC domain-containing protein [Mucilaginibacter pedocola]OOQ57488.1 hypothetical protein BC343_15460 [Mucilaginibacter pedocola]
MEKKLYRNEHGKMIGGVCMGLADYLSIDPTIVRLIFLATLIFGHGTGFIAYIILLCVLPKRNVFVGPNVNPGVDYTVPPSQPFGTPFNTPFNAPFGQPFVMPKKKASNAGVICGAILIVLGTIFLVDELDIIPDWDFDRLWPLVIVGAGAALLIAGKEKRPWEQANWSATTVTEEPAADTNATEKSSGIDLSKKNDEPTSNDNPTTI